MATLNVWHNILGTGEHFFLKVHVLEANVFTDLERVRQFTLKIYGHDAVV